MFRLKCTELILKRKMCCTFVGLFSGIHSISANPKLFALEKIVKVFVFFNILFYKFYKIKWNWNVKRSCWCCPKYYWSQISSFTEKILIFIDLLWIIRHDLGIKVLTFYIGLQSPFSHIHFFLSLHT